MYTLLGSAVASERGTRRLVGVAAQGMTACPCAQELVAGARARAPRAARASRTTRSSGSSRPSPSPRTTSAASARCTSAASRASDRELEARDAAGHRRGLDVERDLRADEAPRRGRGRREGPPPPALRRGLRARGACATSSSASATCDDDTFVMARQENLETIHQHNVVAERFGLLGELRREIATGEHLPHHTSMREWLDARPLSGAQVAACAQRDEDARGRASRSRPAAGRLGCRRRAAPTSPLGSDGVVGVRQREDGVGAVARPQQHRVGAPVVPAAHDAQPAGLRRPRARRSARRCCAPTAMLGLARRTRGCRRAPGRGCRRRRTTPTPIDSDRRSARRARSSHLIGRGSRGRAPRRAAPRPRAAGGASRRSSRCR